MPSAKTSVGVALILSESPSACVCATGSPQSPLLSGSLPDAKKSSHAFALSARAPDLLRLARRVGMQLVDREQERVDRHVVEPLHLLLEPMAERAVGIGEDDELARAVALDALEREIDRQLVERDAVELARAGVGQVLLRRGVVDRADEEVVDLRVGVDERCRRASPRRGRDSRVLATWRISAPGNFCSSDLRIARGFAGRRLQRRRPARVPAGVCASARQGRRSTSAATPTTSARHARGDVER